MRYVQQAGNSPAFLLKALGEASGELRRNFMGVRTRDLLRPGEGFDDQWCLMAIAYHMREVERGVGVQIDTILRSRDPEIRHVDLDDIPFAEDYRRTDEEEALDEFHYLRQRTAYTLWDLDDRQWDRGGIHPYRGRVTVLELVRELYKHDLEHLWQAQRMIEHLAGA
ncbi:MAG: DinB family protein, partial [Tepidiformaceae bacterium]